MQTWARTTPEMARPIRSSTSVPPDWLRGERNLVNIVLNSVLGDEAGKRAGRVQAARVPGEDDGDVAHVCIVNFGDAGLADDDSASIGDALAVFGGGVSGGEGRRYEAGGIDLLPVVEADGLELLEQDLRGAEVLLGIADGVEAGGHAAVEGDEDHAHDGDAEQALAQAESRLPHFGFDRCFDIHVCVL